MVPHILVIDDDWPITELLRRTLAHAGYTVTTADTGEAGMRAKLEASGEPRLIQTMRGVGYVLRD